MDTEHYRVKDIKIEENRKVSDLLEELDVSPATVLLSINGEVLFADQIMQRTLIKGDRLLIIPLFDGG